MSAFILGPVAVDAVAGSQSSASTTFARIGTVTAGPGSVELTAVLSTSSALIAAELRLADAATAAPVAGSTLSSASLTGQSVSASVALPGVAAALYAVELRTTSAGGRAVCTSAQVGPR